MRLENIIRNAGVIEVRGNLGLGITDICNDSRKVTSGAMFIAVKGHDSDGHDYIGKAIASGAAAIVYEDERWTRLFPNIPERPPEGLHSSKSRTPVTPWR